MKHKFIFLVMGLIMLSGCSRDTRKAQDVLKEVEINNDYEETISADNGTDESDMENNPEDDSEWSLENFKGYTADDCPYSFDELMSCTGMSCQELSDKYELDLDQHYPTNGLELCNEDGLSVYMYAYSNDYQSPGLKDDWNNIKVSGIIPTWHGIYLGSTLNDELTNQWKGKTVGEYFDTWNNEDQGYTLSFSEYHQNIYSAFVIANKDVDFNTEKQYIIHVKPVIPGDQFIKTVTLDQDDKSEYFDSAEITAIYETPFDYDKISWYSSIPDFDGMIGKTLDEFQAANPSYKYDSGSYTDLDGMRSFMFSPYEEKSESCRFYAWYDENGIIQKITKD